MERFRIVEAKIPYKSLNGLEIKFEYTYDLEYLEFYFWGLIKRWEKYGRYTSLERAKKAIEFHYTKETWKVIDVK